MAAGTRRGAGRLALVLLGVLLGFGLAEGILQVLHAMRGFELEELPLEADDPRVTILAFGDSHTYGWQLVRAIESMPVQLERELCQRSGTFGFAVRSVAVPGWNSAQVLRAMQERLRSVRPAAAVVLVGFNDRWNARSPAAPDSRWQLVRLLRLLSSNRRDSVPDVAELEIVWQDEKAYLRHADGSLEPVVGEGSAEDLRGDREQETVLRENLLEIVALCQRLEVPLVLGTYLSEQNPAFVVASETLRRVAAQTGTPLADAAHAVPAEKRRPATSDLLQPDGHPNALGAGVMARTLAEALSALPEHAEWCERAAKVTRGSAVQEVLHLRTAPPERADEIARWTLEGPAGARFQVLLSASRADAEHPAWDERLGIAADADFQTAMPFDTLQGSLDEHGEGRAVLHAAQRALLGPGTLHAQAVLLDANAPEGQRIRAVSEVDTIREGNR